MWWLGLFGCLIIGGAVGWRMAHRSMHRPPTTEATPTPAPDQPPGPTDAERRLMRIVESLPLGVLVFDEAGERLFANAAAKGFLADRLHAALVTSAITEVVDEAARHDELASTRVIELYGSGRTHLSIRGVPVGASVVGQSAVVVTIEDITELRSADLLRRDFVANVSHELKTPIGAIGVLAETLLDVDDPAVGRRLAGRLQDEAFRLATTVDDLLTLARIESGEQIDVAQVRVDDVMAAVLDRVGVQAEARSVETVIEIEPSDLTVMGDRNQLISGFANLVDNAVKYSGAGSTVAVKASTADGRATIEFVDHGIGIPEADLERIFERFYRVDRGRSRDTGGTGLGLSIVRHVVVNHAGSIDVDSVEGEGTTFRITLPAAAPGVSSLERRGSPADVG